MKSTRPFFKHVAWKILLISLILSTISTYLVWERFDPYQFEISERAEDTHQLKTYHDFDKDGFSECIEIDLRPQSNTYFIQIRNWSGGIIDQTNYWESFQPTWIMYEDITGDGFDEIMTFTQGGDSLFFYAHDIISKTVLINRLHIDILQESRTPHEQLANFLIGCLASKKVYDQNVIIFGTNSFTSLKPRNIYALDLDEKKMINRFETSSCLANLFTFDLTGDGIDEIIAYGVAYGNVPYQTTYRDDTCWLFVLDQQLNPLFSPISLSEYPAEFICLPVKISTERYLLAVPFYIGEKKLERQVYLINSEGKIHLQKQNPFGSAGEYGAVLASAHNPTELYGWRGTNGLIRLNHQLETLTSRSTPLDNIRLQTIRDLDHDGKEEIVCSSKNYLAVFDSDINLLARYPLSSAEVILNYRENGPKESLQLNLRVGNSIHLLNFVSNPYYYYFPIVFIGITFGFVLLLSGGYRLILMIAIYVYTFRHFLYDSSHGILIVNRQGRIIKSNNQTHTLLHLGHAPVRGDDILNIFQEYSQIVTPILNAMEAGNPYTETVKINREGTVTVIEISIQPIRFSSRNRSGYVLEIKPASQLSSSDKILTWSRAVQKMAHDIKTPLSTVNLNLKALQTRLEKIRLPETERLEITDDITMMRTEMENIQMVTRNFLKFSNLDKPHFQAYDIKEIIDESLNKYQVYKTSELDIQVEIDKDVKPLWADPKQIEMVFHILLENALSATQGKGLISISVSLAQYLDRAFTEFLEIEVADTGPGIADNDKSRIFEPYYSSKAEGTGMGLAIAKKIIEDHSGLIEVHSKPNFGAVFRFSLPVMPEEGNNE